MKQTIRWSEIRWTDKWNEISTRLHSHPQWNCKISASNNNQYNIGSAHTMATNVTTRSFRKQQKSPRPWTPRWPHWACGVCQAPGGDWCHQIWRVMSLTQGKPISSGSFTWYDTHHHSSLSRAAPGPGQWTRDQQTDSGGRAERGDGMHGPDGWDGWGGGGGWIVCKLNLLQKEYTVRDENLFTTNVNELNALNVFWIIHPWL